jgi:hypothetical protein
LKKKKRATKKSKLYEKFIKTFLKRKKNNNKKKRRKIKNKKNIKTGRPPVIFTKTLLKKKY